MASYCILPVLPCIATILLLRQAPSLLLVNKWNASDEVIIDGAHFNENRTTITTNLNILFPLQINYKLSIVKEKLHSKLFIF